MFFGCKLKENKHFSFKRTNNIIHLSQACLGGKPDDTNVYIKLEVDEIEYNLAVLQKNKTESYKIDHFIAWGKNNKSYKLMISGGGPKVEVNITGYIEIEESEENEEVNFGELKETKIQELSLNENENVNRKNSQNSVENKRKLSEPKEENKRKLSEQKEENKRKLSEPKEEKIEKKKEIPLNFDYEDQSEDDLFKDEGDEEIEKLLEKKRKSSLNKQDSNNKPHKLKEIKNMEEKQNKFDNKKNNNFNKGKNFNNNNNFNKNYSGPHKQQNFNKNK
jgi:hypothetical protein